jgi:hypothetical protein
MLSHNVAYSFIMACSGGKTKASGVPMSEYLDISLKSGNLTVF